MGGTSSARDLLSACGTHDICCASCAYDHISVGSTHDLRSACVGFGADDSIGERPGTDNVCHASYDLRCAKCSSDLRSASCAYDLNDVDASDYLCNICGTNDIRSTDDVCSSNDIRCPSGANQLRSGSPHDLRRTHNGL